MILDGASFLVTGGTGSFGHAFTNYAINYLNPRRLVIFSRDEQKQWTMAQKYSHKSLRFFIGDIRDQERLEMAMRDIDYVIHAAALKIIPTAEYNPTEAIATNIQGTQNLVRAAIHANVKQVVGLSTDKAANPCTLYGSTKLCAEKILVAANYLSGDGGPIFNAVRYGNIAFSRGSVIPHFLKSKETGLTLTITDPKMTRFYYTLDEAVQLVLASLKASPRGSVMIPKMPSFKIMDLATAIDPDGAREIIGIRGQEKLHEDILTIHEARMTAQIGERFIILPPWEEGYQRMHDGFCISSDRNDWWLSVSDLRKAIASYGHENSY